MKVGINLLLWTANPSFAEHGHILDDLKEWGFDLFEIGVGGLSSAEINKFSKKASQLGLGVTALDVFIASDMDTISTDPAKRKKASDFIKTCIDQHHPGSRRYDPGIGKPAENSLYTSRKLHQRRSFFWHY